jgi:hypothetical protein
LKSKLPDIFMVMVSASLIDRAYGQSSAAGCTPSTAAFERLQGLRAGYVSFPPAHKRQQYLAQISALGTE